MMRCAVCKKTGLEEDFVVDERAGVMYCYNCAPEDALRQWWPVDDEAEDRLIQQEDAVEK